MPFDGLVLATGSHTRRLPGQEAVPEIRELRTLDDSLALRRLIAGGTARVVVIGAGFIGLEVAATAHSLGCPVVVLEAAEAPLIRGLGVEMGRATTSIHQGMTIRCGVTVEEIRSDEVRLAGGETVPADVIVVGIGVTPATEWLAGSGLEVRDGVVCDPTLRAGGARRLRGGRSRALAERAVRRGDAGRALDQRRRAGRRGRPQPAHRGRRGVPGAVRPGALLLERPGAPPDPVPRPGGRTTTSRSSSEAPDSGRFVALFGRHGRLRGALGVNVPRLVMPYRGLLANAATWDDALALASEQRHSQQS